MNVVDFKPSPKVKRLARQLLTEAKKSEPEITKDVEEIAGFLKAEIVELENRFKTEESLARKLSDYSIEKNLPLKVIAKRTNDVLRYTYLFSTSKYMEGLDSVQTYFQKKSTKSAKFSMAGNSKIHCATSVIAGLT